MQALSNFLTSALVTLDNTLSTSTSPRPLATGPIRNAKIVEFFLLMVHKIQIRWITCFKTLKEIEIKQQDKYCTVKEVIQFRPATYDELRRQLDLRSDSLGAEMKSNDAGYVHVKGKNRKVSTARP